MKILVHCTNCGAMVTEAESIEAVKGKTNCTIDQIIEYVPYIGHIPDEGCVMNHKTLEGAARDFFHQRHIGKIAVISESNEHSPLPYAVWSW